MIANILYGFVISLALLAIFIGGLGNAATFLILSIVCTAGISLVLWISIWWGIGFLFTTLVRAVGGPDLAGRGNAAKKRQAVQLLRNETELALANYINTATLNGMSDPEIRNRLLKVGWNEVEIDKALTSEDRP